MAAFYMDSSGLVKHYLPETGSAWVNSLIDATTTSGEWQNVVFLSKIGVVEIAAAIARRHRMGQITTESKANLVTVFLDDCVGRFRLLTLMTSSLAQPSTSLNVIRCAAMTPFIWPQL